MAEQLGEARLVLSADTQALEAGLSRARQQFDATAQAGQRAFTGTDANAAVRSINTLEQRLSGLREAYRTTEIGSKGFRDLQREIQKTERELQQVTDAAGAGEKAFGRIGDAIRSLGGLAGVVGLGALIQQIGATGQESERSKLQLNALAGAYGEAAQAAGSVARIQQVLGISGLEARQNFSQLYAALRGTGIGAAQLEVLFVGLSKAAQLSGASTAEASGALLQLRQGLASGVLQGDELRSVLENLPAFAQAVAKEMGVNVGQLRDLGSQGKITSDIVFNAAKSLASATTPARTGTESLTIAFTNLKEKAAEAFGPALSQVINNVTAGIATFAKIVESNKEPLIALGRSILGIGKALLPLLVGIQAVRTAMGLWALATKAVALGQAAILSLSGPAGWAALAGGIVATAVAAKALDGAFNGVAVSVNNAKKEAAKAAAEFANVLGNTGGVTGGNKAQADLENAQRLLDIQLRRNQAALQVQGAQEALSAARLTPQLNDLQNEKLKNQLALNQQIRGVEADRLALQRELAKPAGAGDGKAGTQNANTILDLQNKITQGELQILTAREQNRQAEQASIRAQRERVLTSQLELQALQRGPGEQASATDLLAIKLANQSVADTYRDAGLSLVKNAQAAAQALKGAQESIQGVLRGGFNLLTPGLQQEQITRARAAIQPLVDQGVIRTGVDISSPDKLFQVASFAESYSKASQTLEKALLENSKATESLSQKDWNVYVQVPEPVVFIPPAP